MKKDMKLYLDESYLGGKNKKKEFKHNLLADKLLKLDIYSRFYINKTPLKSITFSETEFNDNFRVCSKVKRKGSDIRRIMDIRQKSLDKNDWIENPTIPLNQTSVQKLRSKKLVKS